MSLQLLNGWVPRAAAAMMLVSISGQAMDTPHLWEDPAHTRRLFVAQGELEKLGDWRNPDSLNLSSVGLHGPDRRDLLDTLSYWSASREISVEQLIQGDCPNKTEISRDRTAPNQGQEKRTLARWILDEGENVVVARVDSIEIGWNLRHKSVASLVTFRVLENLSAANVFSLGDSLRMLLLGGWMTLDGRTICSDTGASRFEAGDVFLLWAVPEGNNAGLFNPFLALPVRDSEVLLEACKFCLPERDGSINLDALRRGLGL